jgi:hypothetical protein
MADPVIHPVPPVTAPIGGNLLDWVVGNYMAAKIQREHILNYNGANLAYNHAANTAKLLGIPDEQRAQITPFPAPSNINNISSQNPSEMGSWAKLLGPMLVGAGLLGAGQYLARPATPQPVSTPAVEAPLPPSPAADGNVGFTVK